MDKMYIAIALEQEILGDKFEAYGCGCIGSLLVRKPNSSWSASWASTGSGNVCAEHHFLCSHAYVWRNKTGDVLTRVEWDSYWDDGRVIETLLQRIYPDGSVGPADGKSSNNPRFLEDVRAVEQRKSSR